METNIKTSKKESLKKARQCSNKRMKETEQETSIRNLMNANKMAEKRQLRTAEKEIIRRENMPKKWQKNEEQKLQKKQILGEEPMLKIWLISKVWKHLNNIRIGLRKCLNIFSKQKNGNNRQNS